MTLLRGKGKDVLVLN